MGDVDTLGDGPHPRNGASHPGPSGPTQINQIPGPVDRDNPVVERSSTRASLSAGASMVSLPGYNSTTELLDHPGTAAEAVTTVPKERHESSVAVQGSISPQSRHGHPRSLKLPMALGRKPAEANKPTNLSPIPATPVKGKDAVPSLTPSSTHPKATSTSPEKPNSTPPANQRPKGGLRAFFVSSKNPSQRPVY